MDEIEPAPAIVGQAERFLIYIHANCVQVSPESGLIENQSLQEIVRLFEPTAGRCGYLPDERYYPDVFFVDTLCRLGGLTAWFDAALSVSQFGYLFLSREPRRRLVMLASAYVNDYPWSMLFPRGDLGRKIAERRAEVLDLILRLEPGSAVRLEEFSETLRENLGIVLSDKNPPYPSLTLEWVIRHILIKPLSRLAVVRLLTDDGKQVDDIKLTHSFELTKDGRELLTLREVKYAEVQ